MIKQTKPKTQSGARASKSAKTVRKSATSNRKAPTAATKKVSLPRGRSAAKRSK